MRLLTPLQDLTKYERLGQIISSAHSQGAYHVGFAVPVCDHDYRHLPEIWVFSDALEDLGSFHYRDVDCQDGDGWPSPS